MKRWFSGMTNELYCSRGEGQTPKDCAIEWTPIPCGPDPRQENRSMAPTPGLLWYSLELLCQLPSFIRIGPVTCVDSSTPPPNLLKGAVIFSGRPQDCFENALN